MNDLAGFYSSRNYKDGPREAAMMNAMCGFLPLLKSFVLIALPDTPVMTRRLSRNEATTEYESILPVFRLIATGVQIKSIVEAFCFQLSVCARTCPVSRHKE